MINTYQFSPSWLSEIAFSKSVYLGGVISYMKEGTTVLGIYVQDSLVMIIHLDQEITGRRQQM